MGVRPNAIAGVSAGSVVSVLYASGMRPIDILKVFADAKFSDFAEWGMPREGFFSMDGFKDFLRRNLGEYRDISELPLPTQVCATDLLANKPVSFDRGDIADRVAASCSIPIVFKPVKIDGVTYVDGGVVANLPAWALRDKCKYLIGINCSPLPKRNQPTSIIEVAQLTYDILVKTNTIPQMELCDMAVNVNDIATYKVFNLKEINRVFRAGYDSTMAALLDAGFRRPEKRLS